MNRFTFEQLGVVRVRPVWSSDDATAEGGAILSHFLYEFINM